VSTTDTQRGHPGPRRVLGALTLTLLTALVVLASVGAGVLSAGDTRPALAILQAPTFVAACPASSSAAGHGCGAIQVQAARYRRWIRRHLPRSSATIVTAVTAGEHELFGFGDSTNPMHFLVATGLWEDQTPAGFAGQPAWWQSAIATWQTVRYLTAIGSTSEAFQHALDRTFALNVVLPGSKAPINFGNRYLDDTGWWGLTWLAAARYELDVRGDQARAKQYLRVAEWDAKYIYGAPRVCGGISWRIGKPPDTISDAEYVALAAELSSFRRAPGPFHDDARARRWLINAGAVMGWLDVSGLIDRQTGSVFDTLNADCQPQGPATSYSEGEVADALIGLGAAAQSPVDFQAASVFIGHTLGPDSGLTSSDGVLQETCETQADECHGPQQFNVSSFKGLFAQAVADYDQATGTDTYRNWLRAQARAILRHDTFNTLAQPAHCHTPASCKFGFYWSRAVDQARAPVPLTIATQTSALQALTSALTP
jgi:hypothetical protein